MKRITKNASFQRRSPEWRFSIAPASRLCVEEVFQCDDVIHHIPLASRMLRKGCYRLSFVLAFSYVWMGENGSKNTLRMEGHFLFLKKKEKDLRFKKISR